MLYSVFKSPNSYHSCSLCWNQISEGALTAVSENGKLAHYRCAKKRNWKRKSRAKREKVTLRREIAPVNRPIKIIKHFAQ